jgi:flavin-dependent dehydrogenase
MGVFAFNWKGSRKCNSGMLLRKIRKKIFDVIVIGAGPAGSVTAKRCADQGLETLLLEKRKLPREKVCSGILFSRSAKALVEQEFGQLPQDIVLANLAGLILWVPDAGQRKINVHMPICWRKDLDYWMNQRAKEGGVEIFDGTKVRHVCADDGICKVEVERKGIRHELKARFVVGADGANSTCRKSLFPEVKVRYNTAFRECYRGSLNLEKGYSYIVFPYKQYRPNFWINPKGDCYTLEGALKELKIEIRSLLSSYGFTEPIPLWKDGCLGRALLFEHLLLGSFKPGKGNVLLVGDAAGLKIPISGEGINTAIKSGFLAANSIVEAARTTRTVLKIYLDELTPLLENLRSYYLRLDEIGEKIQKRPQDFLAALTEAFEESIEKEI